MLSGRFDQAAPFQVTKKVSSPQLARIAPGPACVGEVCRGGFLLRAVIQGGKLVNSDTPNSTDEGAEESKLLSVNHVSVHVVQAVAVRQQLGDLLAGGISCTPAVVPAGVLRRDERQPSERCSARRARKPPRRRHREVGGAVLGRLPLRVVGHPAAPFHQRLPRHVDETPRGG